MSTLLESEIAAQGSVLAERAPGGQRAASHAARILSHEDVEHVVIAARGSSDNAARFAQYLFGEELGIQVGLAAPSLFRQVERAPRLAHAAAIGISQSGRSPDVVGVLAAASAQGRPTIAITGDTRSPLAAEADVVVPLLTGEERSVAATKTYLASLHAIVQIAEALAPTRARGEWLERLPALVDAMAGAMLDDRGRFDALLGAPHIAVTGRGLAFATAHESALKLRELTGIPAEAFSPADLMHGPIAALQRAGAAWLVDPGDELGAIAARVATTVVVSADARALDRATIPILLPEGLPRWVAVILAVLPAQAAALRLAERHGVDVDRPHGLRKVTLTR
jgi:glucosamine--fructose-6-phosphate aminotransferase (isomerizing)